MIRIPPLGSRWRHVVVAVLVAGTFAVTYTVGVHTTTGQYAEQTVLAASRFAYDQPLLVLVTVPNLLIACAVVATVGLVRRRPSAAIAGVAIIGVSSILAQALKHGLLDRPALVTVGDNTFPSGHMTAFAAVTFALLLVVPARIRPVIAVVGAVGLSIVGGLLLHLGWHRPSDVFGAILLATFVSAIAQLGVARRKSADTGAAGERIFAGLSIVTAIIAVASFVVHRYSLGLDGLVSPLLTAQIATVAAVLMSVAITMWLLRNRRETGAQLGPAR